MKRKKLKSVSKHIQEISGYKATVLNDNELISFICPATECKSNDEAISYYMNHFHTNKHKTINIKPILK